MEVLEVLFQNLLEATVLALAGILTTVAVVLARRALTYLKTKLSLDQYAFLQSATKTVVRFLEQSGFTNDLLKEGAKKKEAALALLTNFAEEHQIPVSYEFLDTLIEEAVQTMNEIADNAFPVGTVEAVPAISSAE